MRPAYSSIRVSGGLLPEDVRQAVIAGTAAGLGSNDYHLGGERPRDAAARAWSYLEGVYRRFRDDLDRLPDFDPAIGVTRERWLTQLFSALDYGRVPPTGAGGLVVDNQAYPISHLWGATPMHLLGWGVPLDRRSPGVAGAAQRAPHALLQEVLNRSDAYLWGVISNGRVLRLLRDSTTLTGQAFVEFDLEAMFDGELYADFAQLYLLVHQSRVEVADGAATAECWLERWRTTAISQGVRALNLLRKGVQQALEILGTGFLRHPANTQLRDHLNSGEIRVGDFHQSLLRTVYRLLFWSVAEDRRALLDPKADPLVADRYLRHFSSARLRDLARRRHGSAHHDLWEGVSIVLDALSRTEGEPRLGLPGLGGLFSLGAADVLAGAKLGNQPLLAAIRSLSIVQPKGQPQRVVDFQHLGAEELGSIYESLLELVPRRDPIGHTFTLEAAAGNDRKTTGSYYTPTDLVELVLDTALDPVLDDAEKQPDAESALLAVTVCDPAIGSGHFMVAAARRIAQRLAIVRTGEIDPTPTMLQDAMHDVVARCIYGVDLNPMAADLAKVSLWLEAMSPGRPLSFLDHHIKVGNSLLGTTPALLAAGIPDAAYFKLTGDDPVVVKTWKKLNAGQGSLLDDGLDVGVGNATQRTLTAEVAEAAAGATTLAEIAWAAQRYAALRNSDEAVRARLVADAWCAAFLALKTDGAQPITGDTLDLLEHAALDGPDRPESIISTVSVLANRHRLFHWHLEFPEIFVVPDDGPANTDTGWTGGFSAMLGNPPWEILQMSEKEFFASRAPEITAAPNAAARKMMIKKLESANLDLAEEFAVEARRGESENLLIRASGRYPLTARGKINTYSIFAEHFRSSLAERGRCGLITPTGLATDLTTAAFFADSVRTGRLAAFYDFDNQTAIFADVHRQFHFAVCSFSGGEKIYDIRFSFLNRVVADTHSRQFALEPAEISMLNPNTGTLPILRSRRDADIVLTCYRRHPIILLDGDAKGNPWNLKFSQGLFNMSSDAGMFMTADELSLGQAVFDGWAWRRNSETWLPLYEAKMINYWNHRYSTYSGATQAQLNMGSLPTLTDEQLDSASTETLAHYWVEASQIEEAVPNKWNRAWLLGWRDISRATDTRTFVSAAIPLTAVGNKYPIAVLGDPSVGYALQAVWSSLVFDYIARQKQAGASMNYFIVKQLACPRPDDFQVTPPWSSAPLAAFVRARVLELTYTSHRIQPYATDVIGGDPGEPFRWQPKRRTQLIAELDAAMFHLYGLNRDETEHVLDSFPAVRKQEERDHGEFRTKGVVLAVYDAMTRAAATGVQYQSPLDPPPGQGPRHPKDDR